MMAEGMMTGDFILYSRYIWIEERTMSTATRYLCVGEGALPVRWRSRGDDVDRLISAFDAFI